MESTAQKVKTFYDEWLDSQKQLMNQWVQATQQFQQMLSGNQSENSQERMKEMLNMPAQFLQNWMNLMQNLPFATASSNGNSHNGASEKAFNNAQANEVAKQFMELPSKFMQSWFAMIQTFARQMPTPQSDVFNQWLEMPVSFMQNWSSASKTLQNNLQQFNLFRSDRIGDLYRMYELWSNLYTSFSNSLTNFTDMISKGIQKSFAQDTATNLFNSTGMYVKLMEYWQPFMKQFQENLTDPKAFEKAFSTARYQELLSYMFNMVSPEAMREFQAQINRVLESIASTSQYNVNRLSQLAQANLRLIPDMVSGDPSAMMKVMDNINDVYFKTFEPMLQVSTSGREGQIAELTSRILSRMSDYLTKLSEFQYHIYATGQKSMEQVVQNMLQQITTNSEIGSYNDFFRMWVRTNESSYIKLFETEEFARVQSELMTVGLDIKNDFSRLFEMLMIDLPVVPRSEMDDLYKTIHDLKVKVRNLERQLNLPNTGSSAADIETVEASVVDINDTTTKNSTRRTTTKK
jgi:hypothetical protein